MTQEQYTTEDRTFQHLTKEKRTQIEILLRQELPKTQIAKTEGTACSTLYLELARGTVEQMDSELRGYHTYFTDVGQYLHIWQSICDERWGAHFPSLFLFSHAQPSLFRIHITAVYPDSQMQMRPC